MTWPTKNRTYHPAIHNDGVEYVLRHLMRVRNIVHGVLSLPEFGWAEQIEKGHTPVSELYPRYERYTSSGLVLVMSSAWPFEIQHPFGCQHFDGGYYSDRLGSPLQATRVLEALEQYGLLLESIPQPPTPEWNFRPCPANYRFYAVRRVGSEEGQLAHYDDPRLWHKAEVWACDIVGHYRRAVSDFGIAE